MQVARTVGSQEPEDGALGNGEIDRVNGAMVTRLRAVLVLSLSAVVAVVLRVVAMRRGIAS